MAELSVQKTNQCCTTAITGSWLGHNCHSIAAQNNLDLTLQLMSVLRQFEDKGQINVVVEGR